MAHLMILIVQELVKSCRPFEYFDMVKETKGAAVTYGAGKVSWRVEVKCAEIVMRAEGRASFRSYAHVSVSWVCRDVQ
jgi:hypothetical protein